MTTHRQSIELQILQLLLIDDSTEHSNDTLFGSRSFILTIPLNILFIPLVYFGSNKENNVLYLEHNPAVNQRIKRYVYMTGWAVSLSKDDNESFLGYIQNSLDIHAENKYFNNMTPNYKTSNNAKTHCGLET